MEIRRVLEQHGVGCNELARILGLTRGGASRKLSGTRRFTVREILVIDDVLTRRGSTHDLRTLLSWFLDDDQ